MTTPSVLNQIEQAAKAPTPAAAPAPASPRNPLQRSDDIAKLAEALAKAQAGIKFAVKDAVNPHFKSKYADLAAVWEACREPLSSNGLAVVQFPSAEGLKVTLTTVLMHASGQWISQELTMVAAQNTPQGVGSCITYARRYALASVVGIAQDDDDANAASGRK